jgi:hypothetical protein
MCDHWQFGRVFNSKKGANNMRTYAVLLILIALAGSQPAELLHGLFVFAATLAKICSG